MASEEKDFFAVKHEWMLEAVPADGTVELSDGRKLDLFLASAEGKAQSDPKYLVLVLPGGGYRFCSYREDHIVGRFFARAGFDAITIDYPTVPIAEAVGHGLGRWAFSGQYGDPLWFGRAGRLRASVPLASGWRHLRLCRDLR